MIRSVVYTQLNKDHVFWTEKRRVGQRRSGCVAGLLTLMDGDRVRRNVLIDAGFGTLEALADYAGDHFWDEPLAVLITHGHIDHHAELMVLSEMYCQRRGKDLHDIRPPVPVYCTAGTQKHLARVHYYGFGAGKTLVHRRIRSDRPFKLDLFKIVPVPVDHFAGAVLFAIRFGAHKLVIAWDLTTPPTRARQLRALAQPSLALIEATTWTAMADETTHAGIEMLVASGFIDGLQLTCEPAQEKYGGYFVHYSGWEDPFGMLTTRALKAKFDAAYPALARKVRVAARGQQWRFSL